MAKNTAVFGLYATPGVAESAVDHLLATGFTNSDISVLLPDDESTRAFAHEKHTKAPEGTATGVATGGIIGGTLGLLAGIGVLAIPGVGPLIAAGPILGALAGLGAGGAVGGVVGALVGMGIPEYEAKRFEGAVKNGGTLLSVHCERSEEISAAKKALKETGAHDIASSGEAGSATPADEAAAEPHAALHNYLHRPEELEHEAAATPVAGIPPLNPSDTGRVRDRTEAGDNLAMTGNLSR
jgi:hypothetical protein